MARARRKPGPTRVATAIVLAVLGAVAWWYFGQPRPRSVPVAKAPVAVASVPVSADRVDAANEGRRITVSGELRLVKPARDPQLGIAADALVLLRKVEMRQWREKCAASTCDYALEWSSEPIDSHAFRTTQGHENPSRLPFSSERFVSDDVRLGAFKVDAVFAADASAPVAYPVRAASLPPNLAATFRERDGMLYAGNDAAVAAAGDLRVSYRVIVAGTQRLSGIQAGDRLKPSS